MQFFSVSSLRTRLLILIIVAVIPALGYIVYSASEQRSEREAQIHEETMHMARLAANSVEQLVEGSHQVLKSLSRLPAVHNHDSLACNTYFSTVKEQLPMYANIAVVKPNGDMFCSAVSLDKKINVADRHHFRTAIQKKGYSVGEYILARVFDKPTIVLALTVLDNKKQPRAVIFLSLDLNWFKEQLKKISIPERASLTVLDRNFTILYRNPGAEKWTGKSVSQTDLTIAAADQEEGVTVATGLDGVTRIWAFTPVHGTDKGMSVRYGISQTAAFADINHILIKNLLALFIIAASAIVIAWFGADYFVMRRMRTLIQATDDLSEGNLSSRVESVGENDEIGRLGLRFNNMAEALERQHENCRQAEELLREDRERLDIALQSAHMGVWRWEISEDKRYIDERACHLLGLDPLIFRGTSGEFFGAVHPDDRDKIRRALARTLDYNMAYEMEYRVVWPDRSVHYINARGRLFRDDQGRPVRINGTLWDVTARKKADEEAYERNAWLATILEASPAAMYAMDREGVILTWNKGAELMFGWRQEEAIGRRNPIVSEENREAFDANRRKILNGGPFVSVELLRQKKDGSPIPVSMFAAPIYGADGAVTGIMSIAIDLTHQKKMETERVALENQLRQAQKIEAIGQLAGGVAHDFNNILSAVVGYSHLSLKKMGDDDPNRHNIQQILAASERATVLTQSLLAFSRKQAVNLGRIDLSEVVLKFEKLLRRLIPESIELKTIQFGQGLPVLADRGQIEQILMNLVTNARDAMPKGGRIAIETSHVRLDQSFIEMHGFGQVGDYALLSVADTGMGIPEDILNKIFDPFFTTKEEGKGTGLGLSMAYGIVKKHEGYINVYSKPEFGTIFKIYLPLLREAGKMEQQESDEEIPLRGGNETVLLAEDDASVRRLNAEILRQYGYAVIEAVDGLDAVAKFRENLSDIRIVVLDGVMPKMNGKEAWQTIKTISPKIKTIFISGYAKDIFTKDGIHDGQTGFIQKPTTPAALVRKMREVLDK